MSVLLEKFHGLGVVLLIFLYKAVDHPGTVFGTVPDLFGKLIPGISEDEKNGLVGKSICGQQPEISTIGPGNGVVEDGNQPLSVQLTIIESESFK